MIWPYNLIITTNLNTFHAEDEGTGGMTRFKFFMIALAGAFAYYFFPGAFQDQYFCLPSMLILPDYRIHHDLPILLFVDLLDEAR